MIFGMGIRSDLLNLEKRFSAEYELVTGIKTSNKSLGFFQNLKDGDLYLYVKKLYSGDTKTQAKSGIARRKWYKDHGYSPLDFLNSRIQELDIDSRVLVEELRLGDIVKRYDICAIAQDYNDQKGMYQAKDSNGNTIALCISKPNNAKQYNDHWIVLGESYYYNMQDEHNKATGLSFRKKVNQILYKDFEESSLSKRPLIPVYLFVHDSNSMKKDEFRFEGIFHVNSLPTMDAFELLRSSAPLTQMYRDARKKTLKMIAKKQSSELVGQRRIVQMHKFCSSKYIAQQIKEYTESLAFISREEEKTDYVQKQKRAIRVGSMGEEFALKYEKDYVAKHIPGKESDVKLAADSMGYDIRTFREIGGKIVEIHIEVKTTADDNPYSKFDMSDHEKWFMEKHPDTYWLYRIYDVYSNKVQGVYIRGGVSRHLNMSPSKYSCILK